MRKSVIAASALGIVAAVLAASAPADAREYPWCLNMGALAFPHDSFAMLGSPLRSDSGNSGSIPRQAQEEQAQEGGGGRNCGFDSYDQCMAAKAGLGGYCEQNLFYHDAPARPAGQARHRKRHNS